MRFSAQIHEVEIELPTELTVDQAGMDALIARFTDRYERIYGEGSAYPEAGVEITTFRLTATVPTSVRQLPRLPTPEGDAGAARAGKRPAYFDEVGFVSTAVFDGERLGPGHRITGPAVIERYGDTIVIPPGFAGEVDDRGSIYVKIVAPAASAATVTDGRLTRSPTR